MDLQNEVEVFLNKARLLIFVASEGFKTYLNEALIQFIYSDEDIEFFKNPEIHEKFYEYFEGRKTKFLIHIKSNAVDRMSIVDIDSGDSINLYNTMHTSFYEFIEKVKEDENINVLLFYSTKESLTPHEAVYSHSTVKIHGYSCINTE